MWHKTAIIAGGGSVLSGATNRNGQTWVATGAGIVRQTDTGWQPILQNRPSPFVSALCAGGTAWWAAGLGGGLSRSWNNGQTWELCRLDQVPQPITCLCASPRYSTDRTLLAGTDGAGILRSTDGGKRWYLSNFGLQDFTVLALAAATDWARREYIFAGTLNGAYRSSGGGRAWKPSGLSGMVVQSLAASANFAQNNLLLAGTEENGLYRSVDGGQTWQPVAQISRNVAINSLRSVPIGTGEIWLAGTDEGQLWRSVDHGQSWRLVFQTDESIQTIGVGTDFLFAGLGDQGLLTSADDGQSWQIAPEFCGRNFQQLQTTADGEWLAIAPTDGVWQSATAGEVWQPLLEASFDQPVLALAQTSAGLLASRADGLWQFAGGQWRTLASPGPGLFITHLASGGGATWAAAPDCALWRVDPAGQSLTAIETPFGGEQLLALAVDSAGAPILCSFNAPHKMLTVRRYLDGAWHDWYRQSSGPTFAALATSDAGTWLSVGKTLWAWIDGQWQKQTAFDAVIRRIVLSPTGELAFLLAGQQALRPAKSGAWSDLGLPSGVEQVVDLQAAQNGLPLLLDGAGVVWRWE